MLDIFTIINIVSKVMDDGGSGADGAYDAFTECQKLEPWCTCAISAQGHIYKLECHNMEQPPPHWLNFSSLQLKHLSKLDLSDNSFGRHLTNSRPFNSLRIEESDDLQLSLQRCHINSITESFLRLFSSHVTSLKLSHNQLSSVPPSFSSMSSLQMMDISHNRFSAVPRSLCKAPGLTVLNLAHNNFPHDISSQVSSFEACTNLKKVSWTAVASESHPQHKRVLCSCDALAHYFYTHDTGPPFVDVESSKPLFCHHTSPLNFTRGVPLVNLNKHHICATCNCTQYLKSFSATFGSKTSSLYILIIMHLVCSFLFEI